jgi:probable rRNA maturation factor
MKLTIYNRQKIQKIPNETIKLMEKAVKLCVRKEKPSFPCEAFVTLTDNKTIQELNKEQRGIDRPTDVLSFPLLNYINGNPEIMPGDIDPETNRISLGDIVISVEKASEQAESYGHPIEREFAFLAVHGILHLLGYDHENVNEEKIMFDKQEQVLDELGLKRE